MSTPNIANVWARIEALSKVVSAQERRIKALEDELARVRPKPLVQRPGKAYSTPDTAPPERIEEARIWAQGIIRVYSGQKAKVTATEVVERLSGGHNVDRRKAQLVALAMRMMGVSERRYGGRREFVLDGRELVLDAK